MQKLDVGYDKKNKKSPWNLKKNNFSKKKK